MNGFGILALFSFLITLFAGWITHVVVCIQSGQWILLVVGAFVVPVGVIHGVGTWFGLF